MKKFKSHNSYKNRPIKMMVMQDQVHIMTNYPTKYESYPTNDLRGVPFTKYNYIEIALFCTSTKLERFRNRTWTNTVPIQQQW
jgi:hypothetical protein